MTVEKKRTNISRKNDFSFHFYPQSLIRGKKPYWDPLTIKYTECCLITKYHRDSRSKIGKAAYQVRNCHKVAGFPLPNYLKLAAFPPQHYVLNVFFFISVNINVDTMRVNVCVPYLLTVSHFFTKALQGSSNAQTIRPSPAKPSLQR